MLVSSPNFLVVTKPSAQSEPTGLGAARYAVCAFQRRHVCNSRAGVGSCGNAEFGKVICWFWQVAIPALVALQYIFCSLMMIPLWTIFLHLHCLNLSARFQESWLSRLGGTTPKGPASSMPFPRLQGAEKHWAEHPEMLKSIMFLHVFPEGIFMFHALVLDGLRLWSESKVSEKLCEAFVFRWALSHYRIFARVKPLPFQICSTSGHVYETEHLKLVNNSLHRLQSYWDIGQVWTSTVL